MLRTLAFISVLFHPATTLSAIYKTLVLTLLFPYILTAWDVCEVFPCLNGGTCMNFQFYAICTCVQDYEGVICEIYTGK